MIYLFRDVPRSLAVSLFAQQTGKGGKPAFNLARNKGDDSGFEMVIDKKNNVKVAGFASVINQLLGHGQYSAEADYVNWLCNQFNPKCHISRAYAFKAKDKGELL